MKFKLIQAFIVVLIVCKNDFMVVLVTCKNKVEQIKNEGAGVVTRFSPLYPMGAICCHGNQSSDPILPKT